MSCDKHNWTVLHKECPICNIELAVLGKDNNIVDTFFSPVKNLSNLEVNTRKIQEDIKKIAQQSGGKKNDQGKPDMSLLSSVALMEMAKVLTFGKEKYSAHNWRSGFDWSRLYGAAQRHLNQWNDPYQPSVDNETQISHLAHAAVNIMMLLEHEIAKLGNDDRYKGKNNETNYR